MKNQPTHHHYLPRAHLERFSTKGSVYWLDIPRGEVRRSIPVNIAKQRHLYCTEDELDKIANKTPFRPEVEHALEKIENDAGEVIEKVLDGKLVTETERAVLAMFVATLFHRTPQASAFTEDLAKEFTMGMIQSVAGDQNARADASDRSTAQEVQRHIEMGNASIVVPKNLTLRHMLDSSRLHANLLLATDWSLHIAPQGASFVTGDLPLVYHLPHVSMKACPSRTCTPLTSRVCLETGSREAPGQTLDATKAFVRNVNESIAIGSETILAAGSERLLKSLLRFRLKEGPAKSGRLLSMPDTLHFKALFDNSPSKD